MFSARPEHGERRVHGTKSKLDVGALLVPGRTSNFQQGRISNNIYFATLVDTAVWGAELAAALGGSSEHGHVDVVEPTGPFEDDPNVTNKRFPGNVRQSYRTRHPLRVVAELETWEGHVPEVLAGMLDNLARLRVQGLDITEGEICPAGTTRQVPGWKRAGNRHSTSYRQPGSAYSR